MAWTNPKTWANLDPLVASEFNTQFRDNLNELRSQTQDMQPKVTAQNAIFTGTTVHRAVYSLATMRTTTGSSLSQVGSSLVLTFTALSDEVLFSVQYGVNLDPGQKASFGIWKGSSSYALSLDGGGTTTVISLYREASNGSGVGVLVVSYSAPVAVTRGQSVTLSPSWAVDSGTLTTPATQHAAAPMILMAQEIGAFA